jgi:hypothetical protein
MMVSFQRIKETIDALQLPQEHQVTGMLDKFQRLRVLEGDFAFIDQSLQLQDLEAIHDSLDDCTSFLQFQKQEDVLSVLVAHVTHLVDELNNSSSPLLRRNTSPANREEILSQCYFHGCLSSVTGTISSEGETRERTIEENGLRQLIWVTLIFRMLCWRILHTFPENDVMIVPSNLKGSRMPIYIG